VHGLALLVYGRFSPAPLLIKEQGLEICVKDAIRELNKYVWLLREATLALGGKVRLPNEIDSIARIALDHGSGAPGSAWLYIRQFSVSSAYALQDFFIWKLQLQLLRAVGSFSLRYEKHGRYLYLEDVPAGAQQVHIEYWPLFNPDDEPVVYLDSGDADYYNGEESESLEPEPIRGWMFDEREIAFLLGYAEGLAMMREGRLLRKAKNIEVATDADDLFAQGEKQCESLIEEITQQPMFMLARN